MKAKVNLFAAEIFVVASLLLCLAPPDAYANYIGGQRPLICKTCGGPQYYSSGTSSGISLTEGNLREEMPITSLQNPSGPTLDLSLTYDSYNADGSHATLNTGLGYGWTHSYNAFLFSQAGNMFRLDGDGRTEKFQAGPGGTFSPDTGYFESLTHNPDGSFTISNKNQTVSQFAVVPGSQFLLGGPVYRLQSITDRNDKTTTLTYSAGDLSRITDAYGRFVRLIYSAQHQLTQVIDPLGRTTKFAYDSTGRQLATVTDPAGRTTSYIYNTLNQMTKKVDGDGRAYTYQYQKNLPIGTTDGTGAKLFSMTNANNWATSFSDLARFQERVYLPSLASQTDARGNIWRYQYDEGGYPTNIIAPDGSTTRYTYDPVTLQIATTTDANAHTTRYQYDALGNRIAVTDAAGFVTTFTYEPAFNQVTSMTDPNLRTTLYEYDAHGNRTIEVDPLGKTNSWTYDSHGQVLSYTDRNGHTTKYTYDTFGNLNNVTDPLGNITTYHYDPVGNRTNMVDPLGRITTYSYDALNRRTGVTNALGGVTTTAYDSLGRQTRATDALGRKTTSVYDVRGRLTYTTNAILGVVSYGYDPNNNRVASTNELGQTTRYAYDTRNRVILTTNALGGVTSTAYDAVGNVTNSVDANGHSTRYQYDELNRRISITDALGGITAYDYAASSGPPCCTPTLGSSLITRSEDANGKVAFFKYDPLDRLVMTIRKNNETNDVADADDAITTYTYDPVGNKLSVTDPVTNTTVFVYDALNRQIGMVNGAGDASTSTYDAVGNVLETVLPTGNGMTNVYDNLNRLIAVYDEIGVVGTYSYDPVGNRLSATDPLSHTTSFTYDNLNRQIAVTDALGKTTAMSYDSIGNVIATTDRNGHTTSYQYDALNRRVTSTDALSHVTATTYDAVGNLTRLTDGNLNTTVYHYDPLNRRIVETFPGAPPNSRTNTYDGVGNLLSRLDPKGQLTSYSYNDLYYLTDRSYLPSTANDSFTYDNAGRMLSATRNGWVDTFAYDGANRVTNTTQSGLSLTYNYDISGRVQTNTYPSGRTIIYAYDARSRLTSVNNGALGLPIARYAYDGANRVTSRVYRNGTTATYVYNADNWVTSLEHSNSIGRVAGFGYTYDNEGNKIYEAKRHQPADSEAYTYDPLGRLTSFDVGSLVGTTIPAPALAKDWTLDPLGNWGQVVSNGVPELRTHGAANELLTINTTNSLVYDANGNLIQEPAYAYSYDEENRLVRVERRSDSVVVGQYFYDALGRRILSLTDPAGVSSSSYYFYDNFRRVEDRDSMGALEAIYTFGRYVDEVLSMDRGVQTYYYHANAIWSVHAVTDSSGSPVERYTYDAYGQTLSLDPSYTPLPLNAWGTTHSAISNPFLFTGRELDEESGLYYYRARHYHVLLGRFLQRDPIDYQNDLNLYEYVLSNPTRYTDPSGLLCNAFDRSLVIRNPNSTPVLLLMIGPLPVMGSYGADITTTFKGQICDITCPNGRPGQTTELSASASGNVGLFITLGFDAPALEWGGFAVSAWAGIRAEFKAGLQLSGTYKKCSCANVPDEFRLCGEIPVSFNLRGGGEAILRARWWSWTLGLEVFGNINSGAEICMQCDLGPGGRCVLEKPSFKRVSGSVGGRFSMGGSYTLTLWSF